MPTLAELQVNIDTTQTEKGTAKLHEFADASVKVTKALKDQKAAQDALNSGGSPTPSGGGGPKPINDLSSAIDNQTKKLKALEDQRKKLNASDLKITNPAEYARLNQLIDSNIELTRRQGNAMDRVAAQAAKEAKARQALADAESKRLEAQASAIASNEALASKAAIRAQRELDATINGLSAQIKAQQEYNRTLEQLNKARVFGSGSNGMMGNTGLLSSGEYDSYVKMAAAKRDSAFASAAVSAEADKLRTKVDSVTATLGRAQRAEVQYSRDLTVLNNALKGYVLTQDQYNIKLQEITNKRDRAIAAANNNSAAEQRYARELQNVMSAYDPVLRAQTTYNESIKTLSVGLQSGKLSIEQFNKALGEQRTAIDNVKAAQPGSDQSQANRYQSVLDRLLPYNSQLRSLAEAEKALQAQQQSGKVVTDQQIAQHQKATEAIAAERKEIERRTSAGNTSGISAKQNAAALRGLPAQFSDIVVSLQGGQAPLTVLLQQGAQIKDMFGGIGPAFKAVGASIVGLVNPATVLGAALAVVAVAYNSGKNEAIAFNKALVTSGNFAGTSASQMSAYRDTLDGIVGTSGEAATALTAIASSGKIVDSLFLSVSEAAIKMERATGASIQKTVDDFSSLAKDPVNAAVTLDEKYRFLTGAVLAQADALVRMGKEQDAVNLLQAEMATATSDTADRVIDRAGAMEKAWRAVKDAVFEVYSGIAGIGRDETSADRLRNLIKEQQSYELSARGSKNVESEASKYVLDNNPRYQANKSEIQQIQERLKYEAYGAKLEGEREQARKRGVSIDKENISAYEANVSVIDKVAGAQVKLDRVVEQGVKLRETAAREGRQLSDKEILYQNTAENAAKKRLEDAKKQRDKPKPAGALDTTEIQDVKSNLGVITAEYDGYYKKVTALGDANLVSAQATYYSQKAILEAESKAVTASYDEQIAAIKKLQGNKGNSKAQTISLDNQLTKAEDQRVIAMEKISTKMETIQSKENGRIQERTRNIAAYKAALDSQLEGLVDEGARNTDGVGRGNRQADIAKKLSENDRSFSKQQNQLSKSLAEGMDPSEYAEKLDDLKDSHTKMSAQIISNDKDIQAANADWTNGFTAAVENAQDAGMNFAGSVESALTGAFASAGEALATFVTTGKFNFRDFTISILSDMAKIASQQAASSALGAIFSVVGSAFSGAAAAPAATTAVGGSSYTFNPSLNTSGLSYGSAMAQGGAWSGGTQMFATGGAFTNSIVSQPTAFGMANGAKGIMGEAGDEAIVPLARTRNGDLGIRAIGGGSTGGGGNIINVNVQVTESGSSSSSDGGDAFKQFGSQLGSFVQDKVYTIINKETGPGGSIQRQK